MSNPDRQSGNTIAPPASLPQRLSRLYDLAQLSDFLFGSPLGPFYDGGEARYLPHFAYCGPHSSPDSLRLAFYSGTRRDDQVGAEALLSFVETLLQSQEIGLGLNLAFLPAINVLDGLGGETGRDLAAEHWGRSRAPEIQLLAQDARLRGYQGFIRLVGADGPEPGAVVRTLRAPKSSPSRIELFNSADFPPWAVRFESVSRAAVEAGPLSIAGDLPFTPFEIELSLPDHWSQAQADRGLTKLLKRLLLHYRGFQSYALNL